jgi:hypothetical protein
MYEEKYMRKFSALALFAALLCFAPSLVGQGTLNNSNKVGGSAVLSRTSVGLLVLGLGPDRSDKNENNGCRHDNDCKAVPEGGATIAYLGLAGFCCLAAVIYTIRRRGQISQTN